MASLTGRLNEPEMKKIATVRDLDLLTSQGKVRHWAGSDPWKGSSGETLRFSNQRPERFPVRMASGNIIDMPLLVGRPCFGVVTAYLRFRDRKKVLPGRGLVPDSRCATCKLERDCGRVVNNRLIAAPSLKRAWDDVLVAQGNTFGLPAHKQSEVARMWSRLIREALAQDFSSSNDEAVKAHYLAEDERRLADDRLRQHRRRRRARQEGHLDAQHLKDLESAAALRWDLILQVIERPDAPRMLKQLPLSSVNEMLDVWIGREIARAEGRRATAGSIARWILASNRTNNSVNLAALSTRVHKDLGRIEKLEVLRWPGDRPLLPPLAMEEFSA